MSIIVHGMEMPESCDVYRVSCDLWLNCDTRGYLRSRHPNCPLSDNTTERTINREKSSVQGNRDIGTLFMQGKVDVFNDEEDDYGEDDDYGDYCFRL